MTEIAIGAHIQNVWLEAGQFGFAVVRVGTNDHSMTHAGLVRGGAVDGNDLRAFLAADGIGSEALAVVDVVDLDLLVFADAGEVLRGRKRRRVCPNPQVCSRLRAGLG